MKDLAIAIGRGFQNDFATSPSKPDATIPSSLYPRLRINPDYKNCCTTFA